jgi:transcriptional regulator with XRE-family HTH domain
MEEINERLKLLASIKKINQIDISNELGIDRSTVSKWWNGKVKPRGKNIRILADYLGCSAEWFASGKGKMEASSEHYSTSISTNESRANKRAKFKNLCAKNLDILFDFIAEEYGENSCGIENFKDDFKLRFQEYSDWREKKRASYDQLTKIQKNTSIVNK